MENWLTVRDKSGSELEARTLLMYAKPYLKLGGILHMSCDRLATIQTSATSTASIELIQYLQIQNLQKNDC